MPREARGPGSSEDCYVRTTGIWQRQARFDEVAWRRDAVRLVVVWYGVAGGEGEGELCKAGSEMLDERLPNGEQLRERSGTSGLGEESKGNLTRDKHAAWVLRYGRMNREGGSTRWVS
jgi:hypothetical protein